MNHISFTVLLGFDQDDSQTDYQPQQFQRPAVAAANYVPRPKYDGGYRNTNYDDRAGGGGMGAGPIRDNYRSGPPQGDRGGNYDRPYPNERPYPYDRPYVNDRPNYAPPSQHGYDGPPPYRSGPSGYSGGGGGDYRMGGGGGGYENRGRMPIRLELTACCVLVW